MGRPKKIDSKYIIKFEDFLAYSKCPFGASKGLQVPHPVGDQKLISNLTEKWPTSYTMLKKLVPDPLECSKWLASTRFGLEKLTNSNNTPPPTKDNTSYWREIGDNSWEGIIKVNSLFNDSESPDEEKEDYRIAYHFPYLHKINNVWEVVIFIASDKEPDIRLESETALLSGYLSGGFFRITGKHLYTRVINLYYRREEIISPLSISPEVALLKIERSRAIDTINPGEHCLDNKKVKTFTSGGSLRTKYEWACPLRHEKVCDPFSKQDVR